MLSDSEAAASIIIEDHSVLHRNPIISSLSRFELSGFQEPVFRHQSNSLTDSTLFSYSPILTNSPLFSFLQSDSHYMRKGLTPSTLHSYYFTWRAPAFFCLTVSTPLCPIFIVTVYAFICHCKDVKKCKPSIYLKSNSWNTVE